MIVLLVDLSRVQCERLANVKITFGKVMILFLLSTLEEEVMEQVLILRRTPAPWGVVELVKYEEIIWQSKNSLLKRFIKACQRKTTRTVWKLLKNSYRRSVLNNAEKCSNEFMSVNCHFSTVLVKRRYYSRLRRD